MEIIHQELSRFYFELKESVEENLEVLLGLEILVGHPILNLNTMIRSISTNNRDIISQDFLYDVITEVKELDYNISDKLTFQTQSHKISFQEAEGEAGYSLLKISNTNDEHFIILAFHYQGLILVVKAYSELNEEIRKLLSSVG